MSISSATERSATAPARMGNARWRRLTEERAGSAKSVFHFDVQGSVAKSTHSGFPGCASSVNGSGRASISGRLTAGKLPPGAPPSPKTIRRCGAAGSPAKAATATSTTPIASLPGCRAPTATAASRHFLSPA